MAAFLVAGCASAWSLGPPAGDARIPLLDVPPHRAVMEATLTFRGRTAPLVVHLSHGGRGGAVRAHFGTDGGLTALDISVAGASTTVHAASALADFPGLADSLAADLRRVHGDRSLLSVPAGPARTVEGRPGLVAVPLADGSHAVVDRGAGPAAREALSVTLLDPARRPEAEVRYAVFDDDGVPGVVEIRDLRDGHALRMEVASRLPPGAGAGPGGAR